MKFKLSVILLTIAMMLARTRMTHVIVPSWVGTYEAFAHIFVGFMIGVWAMRGRDLGTTEWRSRAVLCGWLVLISTFLWEGPWFFIQKGIGH